MGSIDPSGMSKSLSRNNLSVPFSPCLPDQPPLVPLTHTSDLPPPLFFAMGPTNLTTFSVLTSCTISFDFSLRSSPFSPFSQHLNDNIHLQTHSPFVSTRFHAQQHDKETAISIARSIGEWVVHEEKRERCTDDSTFLRR